MLRNVTEEEEKEEEKKGRECLRPIFFSLVQLNARTSIYRTWKKNIFLIAKAQANMHANVCVCVLYSRATQSTSVREAREREKKEAITVTVTGASIQTLSAHVRTGQINSKCVLLCHKNM